MLVKAEDLRIGDEILVPSLGTFKKLRVRRLPVKDSNGYWKSSPMDIHNDVPDGRWAQYNCDSDEYNDTFRFQFDRHMWLIKRKNSI